MTTNRPSPIEWLIFIALGVMWGSSYLFIKIGVADLTPFTLVAGRLAIGLLLLIGVTLVSRVALPSRLPTYGHLLVMSIFSIVLPFSLITWAELSVASSLAAIITAAVPLFVIVIAALALRDEPITLSRIIGLVVGFGGVVILTGGGAGGQSDPLAMLALVGAAASYAVGAVYARRNISGLPPIVPAVFQVGFAFVISAVLALVFERPFDLELTPSAVLSVVWLGLLGSGLAYLAFFRLLRTWGATRTSTVAYLLPVVGIVLGVVVASEPIDVGIVVGTLLVIGGIALVNTRFGQRPLLVRSSPKADSSSAS